MERIGIFATTIASAHHAVSPICSPPIGLDRNRLADGIGARMGDLGTLESCRLICSRQPDQMSAQVTASLKKLQNMYKKNGGAEAPPPDLDAWVRH